jgi:hypothetical protein
MRRFAAVVAALSLGAPAVSILGAAQAYAWTAMSMRGQAKPCHVCITVSQASSEDSQTLQTAAGASEQEGALAALPVVAAVVAAASPRLPAGVMTRGRAADAPPTPPPDLLG